MAHEAIPCPRAPHLLCVDGVCDNHGPVQDIADTLNAATIPLLEDAKKLGLSNMEEIEVFLIRQQPYIEAAIRADQRIQRIPQTPCHPLAAVPSTS